VLALVAISPFAWRGHRHFGGLVVVSAGLAYAWTGRASPRSSSPTSCRQARTCSPSCG